MWLSFGSCNTCVKQEVLLYDCQTWELTVVLQTPEHPVLGANSKTAFQTFSQSVLSSCTHEFLHLADVH